MANPVLVDISDAAGTALSDTIHAATGIRHIKEKATKSDTPKLFTRLKQFELHVLDLIARYGGGCVKLTGLNVGVYAVEYKIAATDKTFAGAATQALAASSTSYLYLDVDQTLKISTSAWPGGDHFRIAKVTTNATEVTSILDARLHNFLIGIANAWYSVQAGGDVDMNAKALKGVGELWGSASTELTLASDTITPTKMVHSVDTEADAAADNLVTLTADATKVSRVLFLRCENAARVVTIKSTGNIKLKHGDLVLNDVEKFVMCMQITATTWIAEPFNFESYGPLPQNLDANGKNITNVGLLALKEGGAQVLVNDGCTLAGNSQFSLTPESGTVDDLIAISGSMAEGELLILAPSSQSYSIIVHDLDAGGVNIRLNNPGSTLLLNGDQELLVLVRRNTLYHEVARSRHRLSDLVGTGQVIPYSAIDCQYPGTLTNNENSYQRRVLTPFKLRRAGGRVKTAPSGGSCIVDVLKNGASIFANDAQRINIAVATLEDTSDLVNVDFAVGDYIEVKVLTANSAADLTVSSEAYVEAMTQP